MCKTNNSKLQWLENLQSSNPGAPHQGGGFKFKGTYYYYLRMVEHVETKIELNNTVLIELYFRQSHTEYFLSRNFHSLPQSAPLFNVVWGLSLCTRYDFQATIEQRRARLKRTCLRCEVHQSSKFESSSKEVRINESGKCSQGQICIHYLRLKWYASSYYK